MPKAKERELWAYIRRIHPEWSKERQQAYVYSSLRKMGWKPKREKR